jgi:hypothetical protein
VTEGEGLGWRSNRRAKGEETSGEVSVAIAVEASEVELPFSKSRSTMPSLID